MSLVSTTPIATRRPAAPRILGRGRLDVLTRDAHADAWPVVAENAVDDNVFFHPLFFAPAAEALGIDADILAATAVENRLAGILPLTRTRLGRIAPMTAAVAHHFAPLGAPVVADRDAASAARTLLDGALEAAGNGGLLLPMLPADSLVTRAFTACTAVLGRTVVTLDAHERAILDRDADGTDPREALERRRRKEYARQYRRLQDEGPVAIEAADKPHEVRSRFEEFLALEAAGWKGKRGTALRDQKEIAAFARTAIAGLAEQNAVTILTLRLGDRPAAIVVCLRSGHTAFTWKIAYDESLARFSPGAQLMLEAPKLLFADPRIHRIDSCAAPNHPMIDHLWRGRLKLVTLAIAPARSGLRFRAGLALHHAEIAARHHAKRLLGRLRSRSPRPAHQPPR